MIGHIRWLRIVSTAGVLFAACLVVLAITSAPVQRTESPLQPILATPIDQVAILSVLADRYAEMGSPLPPPEPGDASQRKQQSVVLINETIKLCDHLQDGPSPDCPDHRFIGHISQKLVRELLAANTSSHLQPSPVLGALAVSSNEIAELFGTGWWPDFHRAYPQKAGILSTSWAVKSEDGSSAVVFVAFSCGGLCGSGDVVLLVREGGAWIIAATERVWVS